MSLQQFRDSFDDPDLREDAINNIVSELESLVSRFGYDAKSFTFVQHKAIIAEILETMVKEDSPSDCVVECDAFPVSISEAANASEYLAMA